MSEITNRIKHQSPFFLGYALLSVTAAFFLLTNGKGSSFLLLNGFHRHWLDVFFIYYTNVGDGIFAILLVLVFFFVIKQRKLAVILLLAYASTGIFAQFIKAIVYAPRPLTFFSPRHYSFFMDGVIHGGFSSFPSGHTVTAFTLATVFALYSNNKIITIFFLLAAAMVGFSRIYLAQHFLADVLAGSLIGVAGGLLCAHFARNIKENKLVLKRRTVSNEGNV